MESIIDRAWKIGCCVLVLSIVATLWAVADIRSEYASRITLPPNPAAVRALQVIEVAQTPEWKKNVSL